MPAPRFLRTPRAAYSGTRHCAAERAIRKAVLWRKGSFGSASPAGSRFVERMLTVTESLRAQGRSILAFLERAIHAGLAGKRHPSLLSTLR